MELSDQQVQAMTKRLLLSRLRLLTTNGFFGLLLMHARFGLDEDCDTAYTDGRAIRFSPKFLTELTDRELDFVMMHEVMHMALRHCSRGHHLEHKRYNIACDIVVNSNILLSANMDKNSITLSKYGVSMHLAPDGKEGYHYTAEQVYDMLPSMPNKAGGKSKGSDGSWDDHDKWVDAPEDDFEGQQWDHLLETACEVISIRESSQSYGGGPMMAQRLMKLGRKSEIDWRTILQEFLQEEINDYSFSPPDRLFSDSDFFLPDYNEKEEVPGKVWFLIDTSGSMSDKEITAAFSEVKGAVDQFDGKLKGWLGFFDAAIIEPKPFESVEDVLKIKPAGGGGTDFQIVFEYVHQHMQDNPPACIIIMTDGYAPFPKEHVAQGIPVLWLIDHSDVEPPWGKVAHIKAYNKRTGPKPVLLLLFARMHITDHRVMSAAIRPHPSQSIEAKTAFPKTPRRPPAAQLRKSDVSNGD